jgi:putative protease
MSAKDLCTLPFIDKLKKAGITSFKIEGRNREPEYIDTIVRVYKYALNKKTKLTPTEIKKAIQELGKVYTKGFSSGFYLKTPTSDDFSNIENSKATQKKKFIGKINHYYQKIGVGKLKLNNGPLKLGDNILIMGKTTGLIRHKITSMQIKNKDIKQAKKTQEIAIKLPLCRKNDELYLIIKK